MPGYSGKGALDEHGKGALDEQVVKGLWLLTAKFAEGGMG